MAPGRGSSGTIARISFEEFITFRDFICEKTGIAIRDNRVEYLQYRLQERMVINDLDDYNEYYYMLKYYSSLNEEFQELINLITVNETSFFRHADQLNTLETLLRTRIIEEKKKRADHALRVWSAACSTGEEPLTLAMIIKESFPELKNWTISITASDLSTRALAIARKGVYGENSFRDASFSQLKKKYFKKDGGRYHADESIKGMVTYKNLNLINLDSLDIHRGMDAILCRNAFIYFTEETRDKISKFFFDILAKGGILILGNAESIDIKKAPFKLEFHRGGPVYIKA